MITRRNLLVALGAWALAPACAWAQVTKRLPVVGILRINPRNTNETFMEPFRRDMGALGWVEKKNVEFLFSWAEGRYEKLPALAADLLARGCDVIVTFGDRGVRAVQEATRTIPIVAMTDDLVLSGFLKNMARPDGNTTGVSIQGTELDAKRLQLLREAVPAARRIGVLHDATVSNSMTDVAKAGRTLGLDLVYASAQTEAQIESAIKTLIKSRVAAVNVLASPLLNAFRLREIAEFTQARMPAIFEWPETAEMGGLIAYGPRNLAIYRQVVGLVDKVLRGVKVGNIPAEQSTHFELVINMKTAKALGIKISQSILQRADKVIE